MKKFYEEPEMEIVRLLSQNIITLQSVGGAAQEGDDWEDLFGED